MLLFRQPKFAAWLEQQPQPYYGHGSTGVATDGYTQYGLRLSGGSGFPLQ